jgi:dienelactone hydrolase
MRARAVVSLLALVLAAACAAPMAQHAIVVTLPKPATLTAELHRPAGEGPFPAVILLHGCGGLGPNMAAWAGFLRNEGYAALILDSFSGRGLKRVCGDPTLFAAGPRSSDVFAAAAYLKSLPVIKPDRIAAMGFSHGGATVLWAAAYQDRFPDVKVRALIAVYPGCGGSYRGRTPLLMLVGAKDDWANPEPCKAMAEQARQNGQPVTLVVYPEARHGFDAAGIRGRVYIADARRGQGATVEYDPAAHADSEVQVRRFLGEHLR